MDGKTAAEMLTKIRSEKPVVHHITNYVTVNDCANITICAGASPVMADSKDEVSEMVSIAGALVLNIGTLNHDIIESMLIAGNTANDLGIPVILDPVGAGATKLRTKAALKLTDELIISVIKGNAGEIGVLAGAKATVRGVDSGSLEDDPVQTALKCSELTGAVVALSGPKDIVTDGSSVLSVENGHPMMVNLSGTGCMASSLTGAFSAVCSDDYLVAAASALATFGLCGEKASVYAKGPYSFRTGLCDELYRLRPVELGVDAKIREINGV
ncbi:hydroxyethylthiazole kinase [Methanomicrobium sp. W14]|jgi:hydroxyethylthiazole kinase|uniref:hydroxyethylthiazole kinase n=1 Tax=Methanomicrobium sp. W14 TaxID=2817839 RepID=UPI001AE72285|nr:hydroxyethylthiazole kinase [Methanomicrobium sp. W14]MBP2133352.1 hydroxyethylthiazole kinase [Methanomicrobium sp. W14]